MSDNPIQADRPAPADAPAPEQLAQARDQAAAWYAKMRGSRANHREITQFYAWLDASPLNDAAYNEIIALTTGLAAVADDPRIRTVGETILGGSPVPDRSPVRPGRARRRAARAWPWIGGAAAVAALILAVVGLAQPFGQTYSTAVGERRAVTLADGSTIELNTDSQVRVKLTAHRRAITLDRGQALFAVTHDTARPFIVTAGDTAVRAVGTRFEVYRTPATVRVILAEGRVQVTRAPGAAPVLMDPGAQLQVGGQAPLRPMPVDVAAATGWTDGRLTFEDAPLSQAVAEINRYSRRKIVLGPGAPASEPVNGVFDAGDTTAFVKGVAASLALGSIEHGDDKIELVGQTNRTGADL